MSGEWDEGDDLAEHMDGIQQRATVTMPSVAQSAGAELLSQEGMSAIVKRVLEAKLAYSQEDYPYEPEALLELRGSSSKLSELQTVHELRLKDIPLSELGYIGKVRSDYFEFTLLQLLDKCRQELELEQPNLKWEVVAAFVTRPQSKIAVGRPTLAGEGISVSDLKRAKDNGRSGGFAQNVDTEYDAVTNSFLKLDLVYADVLGGELEDPNLAASGYGNEMSRYAETRILKDMPKGLRLQREKADRMVREFYGLPERSRRGQTLVPPKPPATTAVPPAPTPAGEEPPPKPSGAIAIPEGTVISGPTDTAKLLAERGVAPAAIAKRLGISKAEVDAMLASS